jgi:aminoglycoside phosphotransferase (APT) family kinase protein
VFKWSDDADDLPHLVAVTERVGRLRAAGYPVPRYLTPFLVEGGVVLFQQAMPGQWRDDVDRDLVETAVRLNDLQADHAAPGDEWTRYIRMTLTDGADGYCLHEPLREHGTQTRRIVRWVESVGARVGMLPAPDLVHIDFHHRNILRDDDVVSAVVDWEGCRSGDRAFDLITFCFGQSHAIADPGVFDPIWQRATELATSDAITAYVAHMALRRIDWTIRHHPAELDLILGISRYYIAEVA